MPNCGNESLTLSSGVPAGRHGNRTLNLSNCTFRRGSSLLLRPKDVNSIFLVGQGEMPLLELSLAGAGRSVIFDGHASIDQIVAASTLDGTIVVRQGSTLRSRTIFLATQSTILQVENEVTMSSHMGRTEQLLLSGIGSFHFSGGVIDANVEFHAHIMISPRANLRINGALTLADLTRVRDGSTDVHGRRDAASMSTLAVQCSFAHGCGNVMALGNVRIGGTLEIALLQAENGVGMAAQSGRKEDDEEAIGILPQQNILTAMEFLGKENFANTSFNSLLRCMHGHISMGRIAVSLDVNLSRSELCGGPNSLSQIALQAMALFPSSGSCKRIQGRRLR